MQEHKLVGRTLVAIDGAFFDGNASKASIATTGLPSGLRTLQKILRRKSRLTTTTLRANDAAEDQNNDDWRSWPGSEDIAKKVAALTEKRAKAPAELPQLENSGESSCREPIRTPGCLSGPPACGLALSAPETASNYANAIWG
jgi:hypothetical protein